MNRDNILVEMKGISKIYDHEVLRIEELKLTRGSIYGVIGPSGSGKSTFLRIINLLTPPSKGILLYHNKPAPQVNAEKLALQREMALVFQKTLLFRDTVWNNIAFGLKARKYPKNVITEKTSHLLEQVGMKDMAQRQAATLSGGEAQRVAIARAVAFEPELLLLDEPTANLDPGNIELIEKMIIHLSKTKNITVVMVTHNVFQARRIADEVIFINQGKIVEMGKTDNIFTNPTNNDTRLFVEGRMIY